jgi:hypothetical protein
MATLGASVLTLTDWAKRLDPDGKTAKIAEVLSETNEMVNDMMWKEGNLPTGEQTTIRTGLPAVYWRLINQGVPSSKSTTAQVTEQCGNLQARSQLDQDEAELNGNTNDYRLSESMAFVEAMSQEFAETLIYGSASNPEEFVGLANRYTSTSDANGQNILSAGGSGSDNTSIWLCGWGSKSMYGIFPKGSKAGLVHEDLGLDDVTDADGNEYRAYKDLYKWKGGLTVKDWRYAVRIPNIDVSDLAGLTGTQAITATTSIIKLMSRAIDRLPTMAGISPAFYANRTVLSHLRMIGLEKSSSAVTVEPAINQFGQNIFETKFLGIPVRLNDAITESESVVS